MNEQEYRQTFKEDQAVGWEAIDTALKALYVRRRRLLHNFAPAFALCEILKFRQLLHKKARLKMI